MIIDKYNKHYFNIFLLFSYNLICNYQPGIDPRTRNKKTHNKVLISSNTRCHLPKLKKYRHFKDSIQPGENLMCTSEISMFLSPRNQVTSKINKG